MKIQKRGLQAASVLFNSDVIWLKFKSKEFHHEIEKCSDFLKGHRHGLGLKGHSHRFSRIFFILYNA
jgi:hypothetical protein